MFQLDLGFGNKQLYRGCVVDESDPSKPLLVTPLDSALVIVAANLLDILKTIPVPKRGRLILTGPVPPAIYMTAQSVLGPHFKQVEHFDGKRKTRVNIPQPPDHLQSDPE